VLRRASWLMLLAGCELVFAPSGSSVDARGSDGAIDPRCGGSIRGHWSTTFDEPAPPPWAITYEAAPDMIEIFDGELQIRPINAPELTYAGLQSSGFESFRDRTIRVRVDQMVEVTNLAQASFALFAPAPLTWVQFTQVNGALQVEVVEGDPGNPSYIVVVPWNPIAYRWWEMKEIAGEVVFSVSPDEQTWGELGRAPTPAFIDTVELELTGGTYVDTTGFLGEVHYDDLLECVP
jgi:hypothetical protein